MRLLIAGLFVFSVPATLAETPDTLAGTLNQTVHNIEHELEDWRHQLLHEIQMQAEITDFKTDGCSGGLSDGWYYLGRIFPVFKDKFGKKPPWETCCVEHDKAYWRGETSNGFDKRLQADKLLRQCVIDFGKSHALQYVREFKLDKKLIDTHFTVTAELMYRAVRVGGQPCTPFPWRWGYGWPRCSDKNSGNP